jgi:outer membrane protein assembly factor BamA
MQRKIVRVVFVCLILCSLSAEAVTHIRSISFEGNFVTEEVLLLREMYVSEGDEVNLKKIEDSVQGIMDLGLFKSVSYYLVEDYVSSDEDAVDLVILLEEKIYLLILPKVKINEDATHYGIQVRWDNVFGLNHEMRLLVEDRGTTDGVDENRQRIKYKYPNVNGSKFELNFQLSNQNNIDEIDDFNSIDRKDKDFGIGVFKWLNPTGRNKGWFAGVGINFRNRENNVVLGALTDNELDAIVIEMQYGFKDVHQYTYSRGGKEFGYNLDISHHALNSNSEFFMHRLFYRSYYRFDSRPDDNLNVQTLLGHSTNDILDNEAFSLGSSEDLRGYESGSFVGNTMVLINVEYMTPSSVSPSLRYVYFIDVGNTYDDFSEIKDGHLKTGVGMGLRWKIQMFVKLDLRLDIGFGVTEDDYRASFGTRHVF